MTGILRRGIRCSLPCFLGKTGMYADLSWIKKFHEIQIRLRFILKSFLILTLLTELNRNSDLRKYAERLEDLARKAQMRLQSQ